MEIQAINHVCVVATNLDKTKQFLERMLDCTPHSAMESWFRIPGSGTTIHVIDIDDAIVPNEEELFHYYRHTAFEVADLREICKRGVEHGYLTFQMDLHGEERIIDAKDAALDFGLKTVFVRDPDGNLWEFAQRGLSWEKLWE